MGTIGLSFPYGEIIYISLRGGRRKPMIVKIRQLNVRVCMRVGAVYMLKFQEVFNGGCKKLCENEGI